MYSTFCARSADSSSFFPVSDTVEAINLRPIPEVAQHKDFLKTSPIGDTGGNPRMISHEGAQYYKFPPDKYNDTLIRERQKNRRLRSGIGALRIKDSAT